MASAAERRADAVFTIERRGIEAVPSEERHGRPRDLGFLWAGAFTDYASVLTASLLTSYFGLGLGDAFGALVIGTVLGAVVLGLLSNTGVRTGLPQVPYAERVFGRAWMRVAAVLTLLAAVGWFAVDTVIASQAGVQLVAAFGAAGLAAKLTLPLVLLISAVSVLVAVLGHNAIQFVERWGVLAFAVIVGIVFVALAPQVHWAMPATTTGGAHVGGFLLGAMTCFALVASWYPFVGDYARYLPEGSSPARVALWPAVGVTAALGLFGLFGLLLTTVDPKLAASNGGVLAVITHHAPLWVAVPFFLFVLCGEIWSNYLDVYTAGLVAQAIGVRLRRWQTALGCGVIGALLATYAVVIQDFHTAYEQFLLLSYLWMPAWAAILLLAAQNRRSAGRRRKWVAIASWVVATLVSLVFVNYPNVFPTLSHPFNQPLIDALHGADLSGVVSGVVAAVAFWTGERAGR
ncbi:MAG: cytosine permease [Candidatus Dormiibacterota bacterium]